jgi:peptidoglycan hydrolase-like protein with peptidoglycan-binding domain
LTDVPSRVEVEVIQHLLVRCGYAIKVDGKFGPGTQKAVRQFQTNKGLTVDGVVGRQTWTKLFEESEVGSKKPRLFVSSAGLQLD